MCHNPAKIFKIEKRGLSKRLLCRFSYRKSGLGGKKKKIFLLNGWSPFEGFTFKSKLPYFCKRTISLHPFKVKDIRAKTFTVWKIMYQMKKNHTI
jgi:dihydroorotase